VNGDDMAFMKRSIEKREQAKLVSEIKKRRERHDLKQKYDAILAKGDNPQRWTVSDLKTMAQWFKLPIDPAMSA
jgi:hypothetical protein